MHNEHIPEFPDPKRKEKTKTDKPIPPRIYPVLDTDLARDNLENDLPAADRAEL